MELVEGTIVKIDDSEEPTKYLVEYPNEERFWISEEVLEDHNQIK